MDMLLDFINSDIHDYISLKSFYERNSIGAPARNTISNIDGHIAICVLFDDVARAYVKFSLRKAADYSRASFQSVEDLRKHFSCYIFPEDIEFSEIFRIIENAKIQIIEFVEKCIKGILDYHFLNEAIRDNVHSAVFRPSRDTFKPHLDIDLGYSSDMLIEHIIDKEILYPFINGKGEEFSKIKKCMNCDRYFVPRSSKGVYCSARCKNEDYYKRESHKNEQQ